MSGLSDNCPATAPPPAKRRWWAVVLDWACRLALGLVFLMAAVTKITDLRGFEDQLVLHSPLPAEAALPVARILPWLELCCGACLLFGMAVREAALLAALLLLLFLIYGLTQPGEADCGCLLFPIGYTPEPWWQPARDIVLLLCGIWLSKYYGGRKSTGKPSGTREPRAES